MALLDLLRNIPKRIGSNLEKNIGGLLGEDLEKLPEEERKAIRRQAAMAAFEAMARGAPASSGLGRVAEMAGARLQQRREQARQEQAMQEIQRASGQISGRLLGGAPASTAPGGEEDGLGGVSIQSKYKQDPMEALRLAMSPAGAAALQMNPMLGNVMKNAIEPQKGVEPKIMSGPNGSIYSINPQTNEVQLLVRPQTGAGPAAFKDPQDLRKEVNTALKPYSEISDMWAKVRQAGTNPTAANDIALIFGYMKILDPGSVVREGEFATAQNAAGVSERVRAQYNSLINGQKLGEEQRQSFLQSAYGAVQSQLPQVQAINDFYTQVAVASKVDPKLILRNPLKNAMVPKVTNDDDFNKLAPGTLFEDPDGQLRVKPRTK